VRERPVTNFCERLKRETALGHKINYENLEHHLFESQKLLNFHSEVNLISGSVVSPAHRER
jgi:hypothetical protein